jgi:hypothetical protein
MSASWRVLRASGCEWLSGYEWMRVDVNASGYELVHVGARWCESVSGAVREWMRELVRVGASGCEWVRVGASGCKWCELMRVGASGWICE